MQVVVTTSAFAFPDFSDPEVGILQRSSVRLPGGAGKSLSWADYVSWAKEDLQAGNDSRSATNALSSAKRSIHLAIELFLHEFGVWKLTKKLNFPDRLSLLETLTEMPVGLVGNLNRDRNALEHDYVAASVERAQEAIDTSRLLKHVLESFFRPEWWNARLVSDNSQCIVAISSDDAEIRLWNATHVNAVRKVGDVPGSPTETYEYLVPSIVQNVVQGKSPNFVMQMSATNKATWLPIVRRLIMSTNTHV